MRVARCWPCGRKAVRAASHARIADGGANFPPMVFSALPFPLIVKANCVAACKRGARRQAAAGNSILTAGHLGRHRLANRLTRRTGATPVRRPDC